MGQLTRKPRISFSDAMPFKIDSVYCKLLDLTGGWFAIVDASSYDDLAAYLWYSVWNRKARKRYAMRHPNVMLHQQVLGIIGCGHEVEGDHINHEPLDNRSGNLRKADKWESRQHRRHNRNNTSGFRGVSYDPSGGRKPWRANISCRGKRHYLGRFFTKEAAAAKYIEAARAMFGEFCAL